jgi:hypothetical protein
MTEKKGIFRVWLPPVGQASPYAGLPFRDTAIAARRSFDLLAFAQSCEPEGMPRIAVSIFPYEFVDRGREILLRTELYDTERTIHMDRSAPPTGEPHSKLGYSVGEWRDGDLIVTTTLVNWRYFDNLGTPQSEDVRIVERFTLSADQSRLDVEMTVVDPATFTAPAVLKTYWQVYAGDVNRYDCQTGGAGWLIAGVAASAVGAALGDWELSIAWRVAGIGVLASTLLGLASGIAPAMRAARLEPMAALRSD